MLPESLSIVKTAEAFYFSTVEKALRQWIMITIENRSSKDIASTASITAGGETVATSLSVRPGTAEYRCYAKTLWPENKGESAASLVLSSPDQTINATAPVGNHRPWKIYVLSDVCTDYIWVYDDEAEMRKDDSDLMEAEIDMARATRHLPSYNRNRYNLVHSREVEFFFERFPQKSTELLERIRNDDFTFNPLLNMCLTQIMGIEDSIRQLYPARNLALREQLDIGYANHQETPSMGWGFASVLAGSGISHLVSGILPYECPWAVRLEEEPIFNWEGPDGKQILVRRYNKGYDESRFLLKGLQYTSSNLHEAIIPEYHRLSDSYKFNAIGLVGCYSDLAVHSKTMPAIKSASIISYNNQGWDYPRLINASHKLFWDDIDKQISTRSIAVPVYRGDYGTTWDTWPASLAKYAALWRRAQERAVAADMCCALAGIFNPDWFESNRARLNEGWMNTLYLADHAWNGWPESNRIQNAVLRNRWQASANSNLDFVIGNGLAAVAKNLPSNSKQRLMVFNTSGWLRTSMARTEIKHANPQVVDISTGESVACQISKEHNRTYLSFISNDVPSAGYKVYELLPGAKKQQFQPCCSVNGNTIENSFYAIEVSSVTGGITSIYDKIRKRQLVDRDSPYHINQCLYFSETDPEADADFPNDSFKHYSKPVEHRAKSASCKAGANGPVFGELVVTSSFLTIKLTTTITLYSTIDRIDIRNDLDKTPTSEKQELNFTFPFKVPNRRYRVETPGCMLDPENDMRPGAGMSNTSVRHVLDIYNEDFGVLLSQTDSFLLEFGHRTTMEDVLRPDPTNSTVISLAMHNCIDWNEVNRTQNNESQAVFRYSIAGHAGGYDPVRAIHFGREDNNELIVRTVSKNQKGELPEKSHSFISTDNDNAILVCFKKAEEDGFIARLWNCSDHGISATVRLNGIGEFRRAEHTDLIERNQSEMTIVDNAVTQTFNRYEVATIRFSGRRSLLPPGSKPGQKTKSSSRQIKDRRHPGRKA